MADNQVERTLRGVAAKLTRDQDLQKDLLQEMVIHLAGVEADRPGQTPSWYIKSCEYRGRNYLHRGRSVDSYKRAKNIVSLGETWRGPEAELLVLAEVLDAPDVFAEVLNRDVIEQLNQKISKLQRQILERLMDGLGVREIARELGISHPAVIKHRRKIAQLTSTLLADHETSGDSKSS